MVQVAFMDEGSEPTAAYAAARWRENPRISPSSWRVAQGVTLGKVVCDGRAGWAGWNEAFAVGCNGLLVRAEDVARVAARQDGMVVIVEAAAGEVVAGADVVLWRVQEGVEIDFAPLEAAVRAGEIRFYGVAMAADGDLGAWLAQADDAAARVWGRRKRSQLRAVMVQVNVTDGRAWQVAESRHKDEKVSVLELAARLGLLVVVEAATRWPTALGVVDVGLAVGRVTDSVMAPLVLVAEAEQALRQHMVWPEVDGTPLFGVVPLLAAGVPPWPTRAAWRGWMREVWPQVAAVWEGEARASSYMAAWRGLLETGEDLAAVAEARTAEALLDAVRARVPAVWRDVMAQALAWGMASGLPGVTAVAGDLTNDSGCTALRQALERPDIVDIEKVCAGP